MAAVIVIEPNALLRLGILQHLADVLPASRLEGVDYTALSGPSSDCSENELVLLSVIFCEDVNELISATQRIYAPKWIVLLSDANTMPCTWQHLPPTVAGYISRNTSPDVLAASIKLVLVGGKCFQSSTLPSSASTIPDAGPPGRPFQPISSLLPAGPPETRPAAGLTENAKPPAKLTGNEAEMLNITPRQYEVLVLLARGYPIKTVSRHLNISVATAKAHTETLYQRLDAHNRNEAVYAAVSRGATLGWQQLGPGNGPPTVKAA